MIELTEREKELLGYIDKLLKFHALLIATYTDVINLYAGIQYLVGFTSDNIKNIDPFNTTKNMIEVLNSEFGTSYSLTSVKEEIEKTKEVKEEIKQ